MSKILLNLILPTVLTASAMPAFSADIVDTAANSGSFKKFVAALKTSALNEKLKNSGPYTVFAPTDEAFAKIPSDTWKQLSQDKEKLSQLLAYHVVPGKMLVTEVKPGKVTTAQGSPLTLKSDNGKVTVNGANVTESDVAADNGVIHAIDTVVLPPSEGKSDK